MMPSLLQQQNYDTHHSAIMNGEYTMINHPLKQSSNGLLSYSSSPSQRQSVSSAAHHYNDQDQYPSYEKFDAIVQDYLQNLSSKKRDKALIDQARYGMILQVLKDPRNTAVSTAQFRFWVKKMFQLTSRQIVCHDGKPVAMREQIYGILVRAHREAHHGGRDKTSALVRRRYSWIPKELIARFVRHCPFCISRRNGSQHSPLSLGIFLPATPPTYSMMSSASMSAEDSRQRAPSMIASSSIASSNASYPEEMMMMAAAAAQHQNQQNGSQQNESSMSTFGNNSTIDLSWQSPQSQQQSYYAEGSAVSSSVPGTFFDSNNSNSNETTNSEDSYYPASNTKQTYVLSYPSSSNQVAVNMEEQSQSMTVQSNLSVYYPHDFGLKQSDAYSLMDTSNNMTFVTPRHNSLIYSSNTPGSTSFVNNNCGAGSSPSLSPSSSSTSATSSPVHPAYHENSTIANDSNNFVQQRQQTPNSSSSIQTTESANTMSLLSHHQSLF